MPAGLLEPADQHRVRREHLAARKARRAKRARGSLPWPSQLSTSTAAAGRPSPALGAPPGRAAGSPAAAPPTSRNRSVPSSIAQEADAAGAPRPKYSTDIEMAYTVMDFLFASQVGTMGYVTYVVCNGFDRPVGLLRW